MATQIGQPEKVIGGQNRRNSGRIKFHVRKKEAGSVMAKGPGGKIALKKKKKKKRKKKKRKKKTF